MISFKTMKQIHDEVGKSSICAVALQRKTSEATIKDYLRRYDKMIKLSEKSEESKESQPRLVFSDPHIPFNHPNFLQFLIDTKEKYNCQDTVICCGDLVDHHSISRFNSHPDSIGALQEFQNALKEVKKYTEAFPNAILTLGNHDRIPMRQCATLGLSELFLKSFSELMQLPDTWEIVIETVIDGVFYTHGLNCGGKDGAVNTAISERMSTVIGHYHSFGGCKYIANSQSIIFGMNVGCGVDHESYAFEYGKHAKFKETMGCGVVFDSGNAIFVPMGKQYFRSNKGE